eukprot:2097609-Amphidinium_carterae.1
MEVAWLDLHMRRDGHARSLAQHDDRIFMPAVWLTRLPLTSDARPHHDIGLAPVPMCAASRFRARLVDAAPQPGGA